MQAYSHIDLLWILLCAFLVFLMQLGFALIETGMMFSSNIKLNEAPLKKQMHCYH